MARIATGNSIDALIGEALDKGASTTQEVLKAVLKKRPGANEGTIKSRLSVVKAARGQGKRRAKRPTANDSNLVLYFALRQGGVEKALASIAKLKGDPAMSFVLAMGSVDAATKALKDAETTLAATSF
jgi:hypothetical protein